MRKITIEEIVFFLLIAAIVGLAIWKLVGSPTDTAALITLAFLIASSEVLLWKYFYKNIYSLDKKTEVSFAKVRSEMNLIRNDIKHMKTEINNKLDNLEKLITKKKK